MGAGRRLGIVGVLVIGGLTGWMAVSGSLAWNGEWIDPPRPARAGPWSPLTVPAAAKTTATGPAPTAGDGKPLRYLQPVYAIPLNSPPVAGRQDAIRHEVDVVTDWFRSELGGAYPRFAPNGERVSVVTVVLPWTAAEMAGQEDRFNDVAIWLHQQRRIAENAIPVSFIESKAQGEFCAWTRVFARTRHERYSWWPESDGAVVPLQRCRYRPSRLSTWPTQFSHLLAHETTHALGAVPESAIHYAERGHVSDDAHDILYQYSSADLFENYAIDVGHDDYFRHHRPGVFDIADSELLDVPPGW